MIILAFIWNQIKLHWKGFSIGAAIVAFGLYVRGCTKAQMEIKNSPLPVDIVARISADPGNHHLHIQPRVGKAIDTYLPDRPSTFDVHSDGKVTVSSAQWGFEHRFFFGVGMSDHFRLAAGMDGLYLKRFDLGLGLADRIGNYTPVVFAKASYCVYHDIQLGMTYDNLQHIGLNLTLRI